MKIFEYTLDDHLVNKVIPLITKASNLSVISKTPGCINYMNVRCQNKFP